MANEVLEGLKTIRIKLEQTAEKAVAGVSKGLEEASFVLAQRIVDFMPFDTGTLESSVTIDEFGGHGLRGAGGKFMRKSYTVRINSNKVNPKNKEKVGSYAWLMNEGLAPYGTGTFHMGDGSLAKTMLAGKAVGGRFMERAEEELRYELAEIVAPYVRAGLRDAIGVGTNMKVGRRRAWSNRGMRGKKGGKK